MPRREKRVEYTGTLDIRLQCKWKATNLESYRIIITSEDDSLFHFRHYTNREMFEGIRQRHGFQVEFNKYPEVLANVFDEASNTLNDEIDIGLPLVVMELPHLLFRKIYTMVQKLLIF